MSPLGDDSGVLQCDHKSAKLKRITDKLQMLGNVLNLQILTASLRLLAHCFGSSSWLSSHHFLFHHANALMLRGN